MPKYSGLIELKGTFGNWSFYKRKGVRCVRRAGGFTKERLESDPALRRVVQHNEEFGAQSMASKSLRSALAPVKHFCDGSLHNRLMRIAASVTALTEGVHGQRPVAFSRMKQMVNGLELNADRRLEASLAVPNSSTQSEKRNTSTLHLNFDIPLAVTAPKGATHFRLVHALGVASDIEYEPALAGFVPVAYEVDGINAVSITEYISISQQRADITFETTLPKEEIPDNATVVEVLGIAFSQQINGVHKILSQGRAGKVIGVF